MPPRKKTAAAASAPADLDAKQPANADGGDLDALRAEVAAERPDSPDGDYILIPVGDTVFRVKDFMDWPSSANEYLSIGRFSLWAQKALHPEDGALWMQVDPTNRQVGEFFRDWEKVTGIPFGNIAGLLTS